MALGKLVIEWSEVAPPEESRGRRRAALYEALLAMSPGGPALDINRDTPAAVSYVYRFRVENGRSMRFKVRKMRPGWSRIWRVV